MGILSWLRRTVAGFFCADTDDITAATAQAETELAAARHVAVLAVAQAQRTELLLREALDAGDSREAQLASLTTQLTQARARAAEQVAAYKDHQKRLADTLEKLGELQRAARINEERDRLRRLLTEPQTPVEQEALAELEIELRAEAGRLDVLDALDHGITPRVNDVDGPGRHEGAAQRAKAVLDESTWEDLWSAE